MSKKIAQLTKVIYALNTKNDEHEAVVQSLKENHEEELHQLLAESKKKIAVYQSRMSSELESKKRIENLEASVSKYQQQQQKSLADFDNFKRNAEQRLCELQKEHATKIVEISHAVLVTKQEFAENVEKFDEFRRRFESDKKHEIEELIKKHETELESVRNFQGSQNEEMTLEVARLTEKHQCEISALNQKYEELQNEKSKSEEDYELKLQKAQAFYEKELEVLKNEQSASQDSIINNLKEQQEKLRKDFVSQEAELKKKIDSLINQLADSEETVEKHQNKINQLESLLQNSDSNSSTLNNQTTKLKEERETILSEFEKVKSELFTKLKTAEAEVSETVLRCNIL
ncbi:hypothetical protein LOTGIDRAFT_115288 [Lottia gigantea]|uniref:Protein FAM184A/B N-terminal domain-containing protein n=1 Tax=Lottia gigantea TaxID=225164 RepID=V4ATD1_LOTGI|nr:hypothetical protein LOTGIDRAFT_115288 [Lottia gigantea]ESO96981.1 hypothetical protein LOTGIDRAFT_115288 [Lottia gigantea]